MKYTKIIGALFASALLATTFAETNAPSAQWVLAPNGSVVTTTDDVVLPMTNQWALTLEGVGATTTGDNSQTAFGFEVGIGRTFCLALPVVGHVGFEGGLRQGLEYSSDPHSSTVLSTRPYVDATVFTYKNLELAAGGNVGIIYGDTSLTWVAAPEMLAKYWLKKDVALYGSIEYPFNLNRGRAEDVLSYKLGVEVRF